MSIHLYIMYDCVYATTAELNSRNRSHRTCKAVYLFIENICWLYLRILLNSAPLAFPLPHKLPITDPLPVFHTPTSGTVTTETKKIFCPWTRSTKKSSPPSVGHVPSLAENRAHQLSMPFLTKTSIWQQTLTLRFHYLIL